MQPKSVGHIEIDDKLLADHELGFVEEIWLLCLSAACHAFQCGVVANESGFGAAFGLSPSLWTQVFSRAAELYLV